MSVINRFINATSTATLVTGACTLEGMYVNSTSSGIFKIFNGTGEADLGEVIGGYITPDKGYHYLGSITATAGLYLSKAGGTFDITFHIREVGNSL